MCRECHLVLEESFSWPHRAEGSNVFQREREPKTAFDASANIELTDFEIEAETVCIIANLRHRPLEKWVLDIVRNLYGGTESGFQPIPEGEAAAKLVARNFDRASVREEIRNSSCELTAIGIADDAGAAE